MVENLKFNHLILIKKDKKGLAAFKCDCGNICVKLLAKVKYGHTKSCGECNIGGIKRRIDVKNKNFNNLTIIDRSFKKGNTWYAECICKCGIKSFKPLGDIISGHTKSCGVCDLHIHNRKHGLYKTRTYNSWDKMKQRCSNTNDNHYYLYGGRGIKYPKKWENFKGFYEDMGKRPKGTSLDRIDNNKSYSKNNCRWANQKIQMSNQGKRNNCTSKYKGVSFSKSMNKWISMYTKNYISYRIGYFDSEINAAFAYDNSVKKLGYSTNKSLGLL